jgi:hypothetical protein
LLGGHVLREIMERMRRTRRKRRKRIVYKNTGYSTHSWINSLVEKSNNISLVLQNRVKTYWDYLLDRTVEVEGWAPCWRVRINIMDIK